METQAMTPASEAVPAPAKRTLISALSPAMRWALLSCLLVALAFGITSIVTLFQYYGFLTTLIVSLLFVIAVLIVSVLMTLIFAAIKRLRWQTFLVITASLFLCIATLFLLIYILPLLISCLAAVYFAIMLAKGRYRKRNRALQYRK